MKFREKCSCGAAMTIPMPPGGTGEYAAWAMVQLETWRAGHIHEIQPEPEYPEVPTVVESTARVEMALPFGFTREMEGDLA